MAVDIGTARGYLDLDISGFLNGLKTAQSEADKVTKNIGVEIGKNFQSAGKTLTSAGTTLTKFVTTPIVGLATAAIKTAADFESAMSKVKAISGATGSDFDALTSKAREMGASTIFSASEAAEAFKYMAMAGWDTESMLGAISGVMDLAAASGEDLGTVSDIVTDAMTAFGLAADKTSKVIKDGVEVEVNNTTRFVDALAVAATNSNTDVAKLGESFKYVAPVAGQLGYSVEDTAVALGLMANSGIKASQAGTSLKTLLTNLANPTKTMSIAMNTLGVSLTNDEGNMLSLMDVMKDLRKGFGQGHGDVEAFNAGFEELGKSYEKGEIDADEYSEGLKNLLISMYGAEGAQKAMLASQLAGKEGMAGLLTIVGAADEEFEKLTESVYNANGAASEAAAIMRDNLFGQLKMLKSALEDIGIEFGNILLPVIKEVVAWLQGLLIKLQNLSDEQKEQVIRIASIAAAIGPVLLIVGKLITTIGNLMVSIGNIGKTINGIKKSLGLMKTAISGIGASVAAVVAVIAVLAAAFVHLWRTNEEFRDNITSIWGEIEAKIVNFTSGIVERLNQLGFNFRNFTDVLKTAWDAFANLLGPVFEGALSTLGNTMSMYFDIITGILDVFVGLFTGNWSQAWEGVKNIFGAIWDNLKNTFQVWTDTIRGIADVFLGWFGTSWNEVWGNVRDYFINIWESIKAFIENIVNSIKSFLQPAWNAIYNIIKIVLDSIWQTVKSVFDLIFNTIKSVLETIRNTVQTVWNNILYTITLLVVAIQDVIKNVFEAIKAFLSGNVDETKNRLSSAWTTIKNLITELVNVLKNTITNVFNDIRNTVTTITDGIKNMMATSWNAIKNTTISIAGGLKTSITSTFDSMKTSMSSAMSSAKSNVINAMTEAKNGIIRIWDGVTETFAEIGRNIIQGIINGIGSMVGKLYDSIYDSLSNLVDKAKDALDINSPSGVFRDEIGKWLPPGIAVGFESAMGKATKDIQKSLNKGIDSIKPDTIDIGIKNDIPSIISSIADYYDTVEARLKNSISSMRGDLEYLISAGTAVANGTSIGYISANGGAITERTQDTMQPGSNPKPSGGNIYVFYTSKPVDEIEAAKQMRRTERDMAEGF